ncbi:MAG TPA: uroporphyrinogen-III C-methyltransferase, partial [Jatrophihabitantaceae bacterium]|nr:uroporphyrinogen-III C-methyltransferase [Jatrophihabitantaceae bacterium]
MTGFPMLLDLTGRRVVVVGGGRVATRRVRALLDAGADLLVVAPDISPELAQLGVAAVQRGFEPADLDGAWLAFACTDSAEVNAAVAEAAALRHVFCVRADRAGDGTARTPAVLRRDGLTVAVTGGDDPLRAVALRDAISVALDVGELPARPARAAVAGGSVALVGGGPGDPELITVRGRRLVASADVVVVDRLAPRALLDDLPDSVEVIDCGKAAHRHNMTQDEINDVLVERALDGKRVVRLKGGDPFVFGRGGEEAEACRAAGIPFVVVPGVTSAIAVPAYAGIPVTHRDLTSAFAVITGHADPDESENPGSGQTSLDYSALARIGTLVILMGVAHLGNIAAALIAAGRDPSTPAACIERGTTTRQRTIRGTLATIAD